MCRSSGATTRRPGHLKRPVGPLSIQLAITVEGDERRAGIESQASCGHHDDGERPVLPRVLPKADERVGGCLAGCH
jgi:hypothetical protein